jgi:hypothetical protein
MRAILRDSTMTDTEIEQLRQRDAWLSEEIRFVVLPAMGSDVEKPIVPTNQLSSGATIDFRRLKMKSSSAVCNELTGTEPELRQRFAENKTLQDEFRLCGVEGYLAYVRHERERRPHQSSDEGDIEAEQQAKIHQLERHVKVQSDEIQVREWLAMTEAQLQKHFAMTQDLRDQFSGFESFLAFVRAEGLRLR